MTHRRHVPSVLPRPRHDLQPDTADACIAFQHNLLICLPLLVTAIEMRCFCTRRPLSQHTARVWAAGARELRPGQDAHDTPVGDLPAVRWRDSWLGRKLYCLRQNVVWFRLPNRLCWSWCSTPLPCPRSFTHPWPRLASSPSVFSSLPCLPGMLCAATFHELPVVFMSKSNAANLLSIAPSGCLTGTCPSSARQAHTSSRRLGRSLHAFSQRHAA